MSRAPWAIAASKKQYGFCVTIERTRNGSREIHSFLSKTQASAIAAQAARYKQGFVRLIEIRPLTRDEWERYYPASRNAHPVSRL